MKFLSLFKTSVGFFLLLTLVSGCATAEKKTGVLRLLEKKHHDEFYSFLKDFGVNSDPDKVFTFHDGQLRISGQHYGYLATKREFSDFRLVAEFRWGDKTWPPREENARDSGILVHATGEDKVWPTSIEAQIIEGGTGDILVVNGAYLTVNGVRKGPKIERFDRPGRNPWEDKRGFRGPNEIENPHGEWNRLEIICDGDRVSVLVNGHKTLEGINAEPQSGKIVLQSEGAEIFFRRLDLHFLKK